MSGISKIEREYFLSLFNRNGYVLNFTNAQFDAFTINSIGIPIQRKYGYSKGKSLGEFISEANDNEFVKLFHDLLDMYEIQCFSEIESGGIYAQLYKKCKSIIDRESGKSSFSELVETLDHKFSSQYISSQLELMVAMEKDNPTEAIGKAKELLESCCKTILEKSKIVVDKHWNMNKLVDQVLQLLRITPDDIPETVPELKAIKSILGNLKALAINVATLRNAYGSGHGKSASYKGLEERHARLAIGSSVTLVYFLWDSYERQEMNHEV